MVVLFPSCPHKTWCPEKSRRLQQSHLLRCRFDQSWWSSQHWTVHIWILYRTFENFCKFLIQNVFMGKNCEETNSSIPFSQGSMKYVTLKGNGKDERNAFFIPWSLNYGLWSNIKVFAFEVQVLTLRWVPDQGERHCKAVHLQFK